MEDDIKIKWKEVKTELHKRFDELGFIKSKNHYLKKINDLTISVQVITSPFSSKFLFQFWFEFSVYGAPLQGLENITDDELLKTNTSLLRASTGFIENKEMMVFTLNDIDKNILLNDVVNHLKKFETYFLQFKSFFDFIDFLATQNKLMGRNKHSFMIAVTLGALGYKEQSKKFFLESEGDLAAIKNWAKYVGIEL